MMNRQIKIQIICSIVLLILGVGQPDVLAAAQYTIIDLGTLGGLESKAYDISESGKVVGYSSTASGDYHAFIWDNAIHDLGVVFGANEKMAFSINSFDQAVGIGYNYGDLITQAFGWQVVTSLLGNFSARAVNNSNSVVGCLNTSTTTLTQVDHACLWQNGLITDLGTLGGSFSYANDINNLGQIVGASYLTDESTVRACMWRNWSAVDLGTLGGTNSQAYAANDNGRVAGWAQTALGAVHAFMFATDAGGNVISRTDLGTLNSAWSYAYDVNNNNQVVGTSGRAFIWEGGVITDLNSLLPNGSGWVLAEANAISDTGQIVGTGRNPQGKPHAFVMLPVGVQADIIAIKALADTPSVALPSMVVTAAFSGYFYVENASRTMGIRVVKANHGLLTGQSVTVVGALMTNADGERYIDATVAAPNGTGTVAPLVITNKELGGADWNPTGTPGAGQKGVKGGTGLNNIGLLIRTSGRVTFVGADYFYLNDGSNLQDKSGHLGVKVPSAGLALPTTGQFVSVTGISSCFYDTGDTYSMLLARSPNGILVVQ